MVQKKSQEILKLSKAEYKDEIYPSAQHLVRKGSEAVKNKNFEDIAYFEPFYLKDFQGVKKKSAGN